MWTTILKVFWPFKEIILIGGLVLIGWLGWQNYLDTKTALKFQTQQTEILNKTLEQNRELERKIDNLVVDLSKRDKEDERATNDIIERFKDTDGANDESGIDGQFVR